MIDTSKLKDGDVVILRCGGRLPITKHLDTGNKYAGNDYIYLTWTENGKHMTNTFFDITDVEPSLKRKDIKYCLFRWESGLYAGFADLKEAQSRCEPNQKIFKVIIEEDEKPIIEEIERQETCK